MRIARTLLCYSLYGRQRWEHEHEWPPGSASTEDCTRRPDRWRPRSAARARARVPRRASGSRVASPTTTAPPTPRSGTQIGCRPRAPARGGTLDQSRSYRTRRGLRVRARARGGGGRARPLWAPSAPVAANEAAAPSPPRPPPSRHDRHRPRGLRRQHRRSSRPHQRRTCVLTLRTREPLGPRVSAGRAAIPPNLRLRRLKRPAPTRPTTRPARA